MDSDCLVLGAGPGGYAAAFRAADLGMRVTLVERYESLGGVCLNVGCIPSKALLHVAELINGHQSYEHFGLECPKPTINKDKLLQFKGNLVKQLTSGLRFLASKRKVDVRHAVAKFTGPDTVQLMDSQGKSTNHQFKHCIIATGSRPIKLGFLPDDPRIIDSTGALNLPTTKGRLLIIGGGIIGCEMATVYQALGMQVTICEMLPQIMTGADSDLVAPCQKRLESHGIKIHTNTKVKQVIAQKEALKVTIEQPDGTEAITDFDLILQAVGRQSNADQLGLEACQVMTDDHGFIQANPRTMMTTNPNIRAIGDIIGGYMLAHKATAQGRVAAEMIAGQQVVFDAQVIPSVAYTDPEVAWVGLTETQAKKEGVVYERGVFPWKANGRSLCLGQDDGLTKILFDPKTDRVLGGGVVGANAGDLIGELALAVEMGCTVADIALTIHPHPTLVETIGLAAEVAEKTVTDLYVG